jgi:hypothetical protein
MKQTKNKIPRASRALARSQKARTGAKSKRTSEVVEEREEPTAQGKRPNTRNNSAVIHQENAHGFVHGSETAMMHASPVRRGKVEMSECDCEERCERKKLADDGGHDEAVKKGRKDAVKKTDKRKSWKTAGQGIPTRSGDTKTRQTTRMSLAKLKNKFTHVVIYFSDLEVDNEGNVALALPKRSKKTVGGSLCESRQAPVASTECKGNVGAEMQAKEEEQVRNEKFEKVRAEMEAEVRKQVEKEALEQVRAKLRLQMISDVRAEYLAKFRATLGVKMQWHCTARR